MKSELKDLSWDEAIELGSPYNYVLAVTIDKKGKPNIIGLGWWTFVSLNPKMMAISIGKERYSHECIEHYKKFVLCFPSKEQKMVHGYVEKNLEGMLINSKKQNL